MQMGNNVPGFKEYTGQVLSLKAALVPRQSYLHAGRHGLKEIPPFLVLSLSLGTAGRGHPAAPHWAGLSRKALAELLGSPWWTKQTNLKSTRQRVKIINFTSKEDSPSGFQKRHKGLPVLSSKGVTCNHLESTQIIYAARWVQVTKGEHKCITTFRCWVTLCLQGEKSKNKEVFCMKHVY